MEAALHPDQTPTPAPAPLPVMSEAEFARRMAEMRGAFDACHAALLRAADLLALAAGLAMNEPSRIVIRQHTNTVRQEAARLLDKVEGGA
jgi:hypothetical protein